MVISYNLYRSQLANMTKKMISTSLSQPAGQSILHPLYSRLDFSTHAVSASTTALRIP